MLKFLKMYFYERHVLASHTII